MRRQRLVGQLETDLIVTFPGAAVGEGIAAGRERHLDLLLRQQRTRDGSAQKIFVLVFAAGAHQTPQIIADELLTQIGDVDFRRAGLAGFRFEAGELFPALPYIAAHRDDFTAIIFFEPRNDDGGVQTA